MCLYIPEESPRSLKNVRSHTEGATNGCDGAKDVPRQTGSGLQHPILSHPSANGLKDFSEVRCSPGTLSLQTRLPGHLRCPTSTSSQRDSQALQQACFRGLCCSNECVQLAWGKSRYDGHLGVIKYFQWSLLKKKQTNSARPIFERSANPEPPLAKWTQ